MFAAASGTGGLIHVYNFYTGECPSNMQCKGHTGKVRSIDWWEDDLGFTSCASDGTCFFFDLIKQREEMSRLVDYDYPKRNVQFSGLVNVPNKPYEAIVVGNDKKIWVSNNEALSEPGLCKPNIRQV